MDGCAVCDCTDPSLFTKRQWDKAMKFGIGRCTPCKESNQMRVEVAEFGRKFSGNWLNIRQRVNTFMLETTQNKGEMVYVHLFITDPDIKVVPGRVFAGCKNLKRVIAPYIRSIQDQAFVNCPELVEVEAGGIEKLGIEAVRDCTSLARVRMGSVSHVGNGAFRGCGKLEDVDIRGVEEIGEEAFRGCRRLKVVRLPRLKAVGREGFRDCGVLEKIFGDCEKSFPPAWATQGCFTGCDALHTLASSSRFIPLHPSSPSQVHDGLVKYIEWRSVSLEQRHCLLRYLKITADGVEGKEEGRKARVKTEDKMMKFLLGELDVTRCVIPFV